ncbi:hypothetical protein [Sphingobacterium hungaricum]
MTDNLTRLTSLTAFIDKIENVELKESIEEEITIINHKLKFIIGEAKPSVLILNQSMDFDSKISSVVEDCISLCGGQPVDSIADNPSIVIVHLDDPSLYGKLPETILNYPFSESDAIKNNQLYIAHSVSFENESQDNILDIVEILAEIIQPKYFIFGKTGNDWVQFDLN